MLLQQMLRFISDPQNDFWGHTIQTLRLCAVPTLLAMLLTIPVGILVARRPFAAFLAITTGGLARAIPVIVFLLMVLPYLGIGFIPAVTALTLLGISPILLNAIEGRRGIDPAAIDAARGMGMTPRQILTRVEIPLMLPVLAAGVRTAAVQIVATSPLAAIIAGGGYGEYVVAGSGFISDPTELLVGAVGVALLALLTELGLAALQRAVTPAGVRGESADNALLAGEAAQPAEAQAA